MNAHHLLQRRLTSCLPNIGTRFPVSTCTSNLKTEAARSNETFAPIHQTKRYPTADDQSFNYAGLQSQETKFKLDIGLRSCLHEARICAGSIVLKVQTNMPTALSSYRLLSVLSLLICSSTKPNRIYVSKYVYFI